MIEGRLIKYFLTVAREQNMTRAAAELHIAQPTLSAQIAELEKQLGLKLFTRTNKSTLLTEDGILFRTKAQELMDLMNKIEDEFVVGNGDVSGGIYLGCGETHIMAYISAILRNIQKEYPSVHFQIYSGDADAILERLDKGLLDIGLLLGPVFREKYDYLSLGKYDTYGLLVPSDCSLTEKVCLGPEELMGLPLLAPAQLISEGKSPSLLNQENLNIVGTYNLITNATYMVEAGLGFALCLAKLVNTEGRNLRFIPLEPEISVEAYVVTKKYAYLSKAAKVLMDRLKEDDGIFFIAPVRVTVICASAADRFSPALCATSVPRAARPYLSHQAICQHPFCCPQNAKS